jgi:tetratricopeptide (TPR) repeat protein
MTSSQSVARDEFVSQAKRAERAEKLQLSVFPPLSCGSKTAVLYCLKTIVGTCQISTVAEYKALGNACFKKQDYFEAYQHYCDALFIEPKNAEILSNRSATCAAMGWYSQAVKDAREATSANPEWAKAHFRLAKAYLGKLNGGAALEAIIEAIRLHTCASDESMSNVKKEAMELVEKQNVRDISQLRSVCNAACWNNVIFKDRVFLVDPVGLADYSCL